MYELITGDCVQVMRTLPEKSIQTCITSPPYYQLRDYGTKDQIGLEDTIESYINNLVAVFREVRRVLKDDGTLWVNLGDIMLPNKCEALMPHRVAMALIDDGWICRSTIIWHKSNPMPDGAKDRPTKSHEYIFLLSKNKKYYYDADAIAEQTTTRENRSPGIVRDRVKNYNSKQAALGRGRGGKDSGEKPTRNRRSVWTIPTKPYKGAHFATFPPDLIEPCVLAGSKADDAILDPFSGSGTTGVVSLKHQRKYIGIDLNPEYNKLAEKRISDSITK